jgi:hypothetical protein
MRLLTIFQHVVGYTSRVLPVLELSRRTTDYSREACCGDEE